MKKTGERIILETRTKSPEDQVAYLRSLAGYKFVMKNLDGKKQFNCLEIGCTEGFGTKLIAEKVKKIIAIDKDEKTIQYAASKNQQSNIKYMVGDATRLPFKDNQFDAVIMMHVIEHIPNDKKALSEIKRVLNMGGIFFCSTPNKTVRYIKKKPWNRFHVREYNAQELLSLFKKDFDNLNLFCINIKGKTLEFERKRLNKIRIVNKLDFLNLRNMLSSNLQSNITEHIKTLFFKLRKVNKTTPVYSFDDFFIDQNDYNACLDFMMVAKKND